MPTLTKLAALSVAFLLFISSGLTAAQQRLKVSANHRYLEYENGKPFFYLGDTAWELFHRLDREEATRYLTNRSQKGFTVIQASILAELDGLSVPNPYGHTPLTNNDVTKPDEAYFQHVDFIVNKAEELGMFIGMLPTWGKYWASGSSIFKDPEAARQYGRYLGRRYQSSPIIWILGGDRSITNDSERATVDALALGLKEGDGGSHLITFHPVGPGDSSYKLNDARWLDFNMYQSSHAARDHDNGLYAEQDYALKPEKPTMDGENRYEEIPVGFYLKGTSALQRFDDFDVRQSAWWSLLAGACGHTYGNNNIWQMYNPARQPEGGKIGANVPWYEAMDRPGAFQMGFVRWLFESIPFTRLVPDQRLILNGPTTGGARIRAARSSDRSFVIVYSPHGEGFTLDKSVVKAERLKEFWYDPRYGVAYLIDTPDAWGIQTYTPPSSGRGSDWLLLIEDGAAGFPVPGARR
jgi:hypothetical protein